MYHSAALRTAQRTPEAAGSAPGTAAERAVARVRKLLTAYLPGMPFDRATLLSALNESPIQGTERLFALGWAHWLDGRPERADLALAEAVRLARQENAAELLAESAYW